jgi:hypothetical protein
MSPDIGSFLSQILPVLLVYLMAPIAILIVWFSLVRPYLKKRSGEDEAPAIETDSDTPNLGAMVANDAGNTSSSKVDTGMLPDLDMILQAADAAEQVQNPEPIDDGMHAITMNTGQETRAEAMLMVLRDARDGRLLVKIGDTGYRSLKDTGEPKRHFTSIMKELSQYILAEDTSEAVASKAPQPPVQETPQEPLPSETPTPSVDTDDVQDDSQDVDASEGDETTTPPKKTSTVTVPTLADGSVPGDLPSYRFDDNPAKIEKKRGGRVKVEFTPPPDLDIPSAIEAYLQYKIQYAPEFQGRNIHVLPAIHGGVRIRVGEDYFDAVSDVTDDEVRAFLQETIAEWQERQ